MNPKSDMEINRLHLGCGLKILEGWVNLDVFPGPGVDVVADLDDCASKPLPFDDDTFDELLGSHLLEHIRSTLPLMQELHRIARPGARALFLIPYGGSDDAYEDPTHVRPYFLNSFVYFAQPFYFRADYGYRGDWQAETIILKVSREKHQGRAPQDVLQEVLTYRNVVREMNVILRAVKPIREPKGELRQYPKVDFMLVDP